MKKLICNILIISITIVSCASSASEISAAYVSPTKYMNYDCSQINIEKSEVERRVNELYYKVEKRAKNDRAAMGVGMVLFWPSLFFLKGDSPEAAEYAQMKGEYDALRSISVQKKCGTGFSNDLMDTIDAEKNNPNN
tara:strand:- start:220 stop:630 length:411 start_codon:yes stop_codon:yes gene_type:complete